MLTTATLSNASQIVGTFMGEMPHNAQKSVKNLQQVLCVTTTSKHAKLSKDLLNDVLNIKQQVLSDTEISTESVSFLANAINGEMLQGVQVILDKIQYFLLEGASIEIDDDNMIGFMNNFAEAKEELILLSDYLHLVSDVQKSKQEIALGDCKIFTFEEFIEHLNAA